jgi:hypothetical protein
LDDKIVAGLKTIYDESPVRQGRKFWHYGKDLETIRRENATYSEASEFLGAFFQDDLIGLLKMVYVGTAASIMQIICKAEHADKRPANALLSRAIEICAEKRIAYLVYGSYVYGNDRDATLTLFKHRNGFEEMLLPRYFVPLTFKGKLAIGLGLHLGLRRFLPGGVQSALRQMRAAALERLTRLRTGEGNSPAMP